MLELMIAFMVLGMIIAGPLLLLNGLLNLLGIGRTPDADKIAEMERLLKQAEDDLAEIHARQDRRKLDPKRLP